MTSPVFLLVAKLTLCGKALQPALFVKPGDVHLIPEGSVKLAGQVSEMISANFKTTR